jgi:hypothetical protein
MEELFWKPRSLVWSNADPADTMGSLSGDGQDI